MIDNFANLFNIIAKSFMLVAVSVLLKAKLTLSNRRNSDDRENR